MFQIYSNTVYLRGVLAITLLVRYDLLIQNSWAWWVWGQSRHVYPSHPSTSFCVQLANTYLVSSYPPWNLHSRYLKGNTFGIFVEYYYFFKVAKTVVLVYH